MQRLGVVLSQFGADKLAETYLRQAYEADRNRVEPLIQIAQMRSSHGDNVGAFEFARLAFAHSPSDATVLAALFNVTAGLNQFSKVVEDLKRSLNEVAGQVTPRGESDTVATPLAARLIEISDTRLPIVLYDIGARDALRDPVWTTLPARAIQLHGFEPDDDECARLEQEAKDHGYDFHYHPFALWSRSEEIEFELNKASGGGSVVPQNRAVTDRWKFINPTEAKPSSEIFFPSVQRKCQRYLSRTGSALVPARCPISSSSTYKAANWKFCPGGKTPEGMLSASTSKLGSSSPIRDDRCFPTLTCTCAIEASASSTCCPTTT